MADQDVDDAMKPKSLTYRHAQKEAMQQGDANTYFMNKTPRRKSGGKKSSGKRGSK